MQKMDDVSISIDKEPKDRNKLEIEKDEYQSGI